jgi:hypothetical protein
MKQYKKLFLVGNSYLNKKLLNILNTKNQKNLKFDKIKIINLYNPYKIYIPDFQNSIIVYSSFPSTNFYNYSFFKLYIYLKGIYLKILGAIKAFKEINCKQVYLNSYRTFYKPLKYTKTSFDFLYTYYNKKIYEKTKYFNNVSHFFLPFIYDKDLIQKENSLFNRWNKSKKIKLDNNILPTLSFNEFSKLFFEKLKELEDQKFHYIFPAKEITIEELFQIYQYYKRSLNNENSIK